MMISGWSKRMRRMKTGVCKKQRKDNLLQDNGNRQVETSRLRKKVFRSRREADCGDGRSDQESKIQERARRQDAQ